MKVAAHIMSVKSVQSTLSHLITTSAPHATFTRFLVEHGLFYPGSEVPKPNPGALNVKSRPQDERAKVCGTSGSVRHRFTSAPVKSD